MAKKIKTTTVLSKFFVGEKISTKKAFTFIEVIMATFIFSLIMIATANFFSSSVFSQKNAKATQKNLQQAQFAINLMAKTLRTSSVASYTSSSIIAYDYSQSKCIEYNFNNVVKKIQTRSADYTAAIALISPDPKSWCQTVSLPSSYSNMVSDSVNNLVFFVIPSTSAPKLVGKVTISAEICATPDCSGVEKDRARVQTTVSLRDYKESGV